VKTVAFDLDETLGVPVTDGRSVIGFQLRAGADELLRELAAHYRLVLWSVSSRAYVEKALDFALRPFFASAYTWDDAPAPWKDVRTLGVDYLVDDSEHHLQAARRHGLESRYILIPAYGSPADLADPAEWVRIVRAVLLPDAVRPGPRPAI
jgi:phosphoglycolate phosphatase-like HAD superfamily hydrolase